VSEFLVETYAPYEPASAAARVKDVSLAADRLSATGAFPGASYLAALDRIIHLHYSTVVTVLVIVGFNLVQNILLLIPILAFRIWPKKAPAAIDSAKAWASRRGRRDLSWALGLLGVALAIPSVIALLSR